MAQSLSQRLVHRLIVLPLMRVAERLALWSMTLSNFCLGLTCYMRATKNGGSIADLSLQEKCGQAIMTAPGREMTNDELVSFYLSQLLEADKPKVFH